MRAWLWNSFDEQRRLQEDHELSRILAAGATRGAPGLPRLT
jgi:hypothetical protein